MDRLSDEEKKEAMAWAKKVHPHLLENTDLVYMLWRKQNKNERITDKPGNGALFSYLKDAKHKNIQTGIVTVVEVVRVQRGWRRCKACFRKDLNCVCKVSQEVKDDPARYDMIQNVIYLVGDNTLVVQGERYVINDNPSDYLEEGKTYWVRYKREYSAWFSCDVVIITTAEELDPDVAKSYIEFWDTFSIVHSMSLPEGSFMTTCKKKKLDPEDIKSRFNLEVVNQILVRRGE